MEKVGEGVTDYSDGLNAAHVYKDRKGTRLILFTGPYDSYDEAILSRISRHSARFIDKNLTGFRSGLGVGLGDTRHHVLTRMGKPSESDRFRGYEILLYLGAPSFESFNGKKYKDEYAQAIILQKGRVVEIGMSLWSNAPVP